VLEYPLPSVDELGRFPVKRFWWWKAEVPGHWYQKEFQYFNLDLARMQGLLLAWFVNDEDTTCYTAVSFKSEYDDPTHAPQEGWCGWHGRFQPIWAPSQAMDIEFDYDGRPEQLHWFKKRTYVTLSPSESYWEFDGTDYRNRLVEMRATTSITCVAQDRSGQSSRS